MLERLKAVKARIKSAALACGRDPKTIRLVAVSKTMPIERVRDAIEAGATCLGENYVQEARAKYQALSHYPVAWHFIGHLQTNKAKYVVRMFDLIHSVDSYKLARELDKQAQKIGKRQAVLIQVNVARELTKSGTLTENIHQLLTDISRLENVAVQGLMTMPPFFDDPEQARPYFQTLRKLRDQLRNAAMADIVLDELSMGMTGDFEAAIDEGSTIVRIGTAIFGDRA